MNEALTPNIKISKTIEWMRPYIMDALKLVPEIRLVRSVIARRPKNDNNVQRIHAIIEQNANKTFRIAIMSARKSITRLEPVETKIRPYSRIELLEFLAHELAHTKHWDHTPDRKILECKLCIVFMKRLSKSGYISEEVELDRNLGSFDTIEL